MLPEEDTFYRLGWLDWQLASRGCASACMLICMPSFTGSAWLPCRAHALQLCEAVASSADCLSQAPVLIILRLALCYKRGLACVWLQLGAGLRCSHPSPFCAAPLNAPAQI